MNDAVEMFFRAAADRVHAYAEGIDKDSGRDPAAVLRGLRELADELETELPPAE